LLKALVYSFVQITGPLIRIIGDRFPWQIKAAILKTLGLLIRQASLFEYSFRLQVSVSG